VVLDDNIGVGGGARERLRGKSAITPRGAERRRKSGARRVDDRRRRGINGIEPRQNARCRDCAGEGRGAFTMGAITMIEK